MQRFGRRNRIYPFSGCPLEFIDPRKLFVVTKLGADSLVGKEKILAQVALGNLQSFLGEPERPPTDGPQGSYNLLVTFTGQPGNL